MYYVKEMYCWQGNIKEKKYPCQNYIEAEKLVRYLVNQGCQNALFICSLVNGKEYIL